MKINDDDDDDDDDGDDKCTRFNFSPQGTKPFSLRLIILNFCYPMLLSGSDRSKDGYLTIIPRARMGSE